MVSDILCHSCTDYQWNTVYVHQPGMSVPCYSYLIALLFTLKGMQHPLNRLQGSLHDMSHVEAMFSATPVKNKFTLVHSVKSSLRF